MEEGGTEEGWRREGGRKEEDRKKKGRREGRRGKEGRRKEDGGREGEKEERKISLDVETQREGSHMTEAEAGVHCCVLGNRIPWVRSGRGRGIASIWSPRRGLASADTMTFILQKQEGISLNCVKHNLWSPLLSAGSSETEASGGRSEMVLCLC